MAPPPIVLFSSPSVESGHSSVENSKNQEIKLEINESMMTTPAQNIVPSAFSLSVQPDTFTSEQSTVASTVIVMYTSRLMMPSKYSSILLLCHIFQTRYNHQHQYKIDHHPMDMAAGNSWMMPPTGSPFWPLPLHNYCQTPNLQQVPLDCNLPPDWRSCHTHHPMLSYSLPYESYSQYMKTEKNGNYYEHDGTNNN